MINNMTIIDKAYLKNEYSIYFLYVILFMFSLRLQLNTDIAFTTDFKENQ